ncbi:hypothetical protein HG530_014389 [Fusarium avenaceum]|nr:hypothetical protein HG530_014389 [Fusarium avenaceum]
MPFSTAILAQRKLRPPEQDVIRSATPADDSVKTNAHNSCLGVVTPATAINETSCQSDNVLQGTAQRNTSDVGDHLDVEADAVISNIDTLDTADSASVRKDVSVDLLADVCDELVGEVEDEDGGVLDSVADVGVGDEIGGQSDAW